MRAVYRISMPMDVWTEVKDESEVQKKDRAARDSANKANGRAGEVAANDVPQDRGRGGRGGRGRVDRNNNNDGPPPLVKAIMNPLKVDISAITMEYGLYNQRFWLPRTQALEGEAQVMFMRVPVTVEQKFTYASVNALAAPLPIPPRTISRLAVLRDSLDSAKTNRTLRDSLVREAMRVRGKEIAAQRENATARRPACTTRSSAGTRARCRSRCACRATPRNSRTRRIFRRPSTTRATRCSARASATR